MYKCSECSRAMGIMLGLNGTPELFRCHVTGRVAHTIPKLPISRTTPARRAGLRDLSKQTNRHEGFRRHEEWA